MNSYIVLIRGINVGGRNKVSMPELKLHLEDAGYGNVRTYINSGNVIIESNESAASIKSTIESNLPIWFKLDSEIIKVLVIDKGTLSSIVESKPQGFGDNPDTYHSDVFFLIDVNADQAFEAFKPKEGVDTVWKGEGAIYSQRRSLELTKSHLNKVIASPLYKSMTIRNWNTTMKLFQMINDN